MVEQAELLEKADSRRIMLRILGQWKLILTVTILGAMIAAVLYYVVKDVIPGETPYTAETTLYVEFEADYLVADQYYNAYTWNQIAKTNVVLGRAMEYLPDSYTMEYVEDAMEVKLYADVRVMTLYVRDYEKQKALQMTEALVTALEEFGEYQREFARIYQMDETLVERLPRELLTERAALLGALLAFVLIVAIIWIRHIMDDSVLIPEECIKRLSIPCQAVFADNRPWNQNEWELSKAKVCDSVLLLEDELKNSDVLKKTGGKKTFLYGELDDGAIKSLQECGHVILVIRWGANQATYILHMLAELSKNGVTVSSVILWNADAGFLNRYYHR